MQHRSWGTRHELRTWALHRPASPCSNVRHLPRAVRHQQPRACLCAFAPYDEISHTGKCARDDNFADTAARWTAGAIPTLACTGARLAGRPYVSVKAHSECIKGKRNEARPAHVGAPSACNSAINRAKSAKGGEPPIPRTCLHAFARLVISYNTMRRRATDRTTSHELQRTGRLAKTCPVVFARASRCGSTQNRGSPLLR